MLFRQFLVLCWGLIFVKIESQLGHDQLYDYLGCILIAVFSPVVKKNARLEALTPCFALELLAMFKLLLFIIPSL